jgi:hypothetical protein
MAGKVYFGNTKFQTWIDAPSTGMTAASGGNVVSTDLLNGRSFVKRSQGSSRKFSASWTGSLNNSDLTQNLQTIKDFADGVYGAENVYWLDPYAIDQNVLPPHWAAPGLTGKDWPTLNSTTPTITTLAGTSNVYANNFPQTYATYTGSGTTKYIDIIIPTSYYFHFGWHATSSGLVASSVPGFSVTKYLRTTNVADATIEYPASLIAGGTTRTNLVVNGTTYSRVRITFTANSGTSSIVGAIAQVLNSATATTGGYIPGKGTSALQFASPLEIEYYSSAINSGQIGLSTTFVEVD